MDASKLIEIRRQKANVYVNRGGNGAVDSSLHIYNQRVKAAAGSLQSPTSFIPSAANPGGCCPPPPSPGPNNYLTNRLQVGSAGGRTITYDALTSYAAGKAVCCGPPPATTPPQGIYYPTCCTAPETVASTYNPPCLVPGYNQTPHYVNNCCETVPQTGQVYSVFKGDGTLNTVPSVPEQEGPN